MKSVSLLMSMYVAAGNGMRHWK